MLAALAYLIVSLLQDSLSTIEVERIGQRDLEGARLWTFFRSITSLVVYAGGVIWILREPNSLGYLAVAWITSDMIGLEIGMRLSRWLDKGSSTNKPHGST